MKSDKKLKVIDSWKLDGLDATFRPKAIKVIEMMGNKGWNIRIVWGRRSKSENDKLVKKGLAIPNSTHLEGKAIDLIDRNVGYSENRNHNFYKDLKRFSQQTGVVWGGNFKSKWDPCHIEAK